MQGFCLKLTYFVFYKRPDVFLKIADIPFAKQGLRALRQPPRGLELPSLSLSLCSSKVELRQNKAGGDWIGVAQTICSVANKKMFALD